MVEKEGRAVLAASTGGHLAQLHRLRGQFDDGHKPLWVTFDNAQSRSLLEGEDVVFLPYIASRDWKSASKAIPVMLNIFRDQDCAYVFSTGAAIAVPVFLAAAARGIPRIYLESVSRFDGPSLSGRILAAIPGTRTYTQHAQWATKKWQKGPSVLDDYQVETVPAHYVRRPLKIFVTLGTIRPYRFDRAVDAVLAAAEGQEIVWQLGATRRADLPGEAVEMMNSAEFDKAVLDADVVITHAGVGSAMRVLDLGKVPVLVTRMKRHKEHVDDHQAQITRELVRRGLAHTIDLENPSGAALERVLGLRTFRAGIGEYSAEPPLTQ